VFTTEKAVKVDKAYRIHCNKCEMSGEYCYATIDACIADSLRMGWHIQRARKNGKVLCPTCVKYSKPRKQRA